MVIWVIGLSAAGKTTIGKRLYERLKPTIPNLVFLDGDDVRRVLGNDLGHTLEDRRRNADRICRLCEYFSSQQIHVICAILSLFPESRLWNREHLADYVEVYVRVSLDRLRQREVKGLYSGFDAGEIRGVAGLDIPFAEPTDPDLILDNEMDLPSVDPLVDRILELVRERGFGAVPASAGGPS